MEEVHDKTDDNLERVLWFMTGLAVGIWGAVVVRMVQF